MDDHLGLTDAVVHCESCQQAYLLEMLDWADSERAFRVSRLVDDHARRLLRDLQRGSCDIQRAGAQVQHLKTASVFAPCVILVDTSRPQITNVAKVATATDLPGGGWRDLPCDGTWIRYAGDPRNLQPPTSTGSNTAIENE